MVIRTVHILSLAILFCLAPMQAKEESLTEEAIRELAETYLTSSSMPSKGEITNYFCMPPNQSCNNFVDPYSEAIQEDPYFTLPAPQEIHPMPYHPGFAGQAPGAMPPSGGQHPMSKQPPSAPLKIVPNREPGNKKPECGATQEGYTINFEDISVIQLIQFISKISGTNYIFNSEDLQFNITIVSEDPTSVVDLTSALLQILKMHSLSVVEQGNNVLIYKNQNLSKVSTVITDANVNEACATAVVTRVFKLYNIKAEKVASIIRPLLSQEAIVEPSPETCHLIVTDITANVGKITDLLNALDTPMLTAHLEDYTAQNADAVALSKYAEMIIGYISCPDQSVKLIGEPISNKIFLIGSPFMIETARKVLASLDVPGANLENAFGPDVPPPTLLENNSFYMYKLKYQSGQEIADALREIGNNLQYTGVTNLEFVNTLYTVQWIEVNNSIVITGTEDAIEKVVTLINDLDQAPKQVYVEVLVIDTTLQNALDFGVQWVALGDQQNKLAFATGLLGNTPPNSSIVAPARAVANNSTGQAPFIPNPAAVPVTVPAQLAGTNATGFGSDFMEAFSLGIIGNIISHGGRSFLTLGALLSALDEDADTSVVLNPKIMVEDTQPANFFVGQNIPYQTTSTVIQQTGSVTQNIQYEDIGVQLQVTPTIAPNNIVTLQINQTVAEVFGAPAGGANLTPVTNKQLVTTRVHVPDGAFLVMSGHVRDQCSYVRSGIPCLGTLPLIGPAFGRTIEQRVKRNLIFFIRPKVVTSIQEGVCLTNQEGYDYNWNTNPCSLRECCTDRAPECEVYPAPPLCPVDFYPTEEYPKGRMEKRKRDYYSEHNKEDAQDINEDLKRFNATPAGGQFHLDPSHSAHPSNTQGIYSNQGAQENYNGYGPDPYFNFPQPGQGPVPAPGQYPIEALPPYPGTGYGPEYPPPPSYY